ncbi:hypothetical protein [Staphylococcus lugdunensis]|uniref:hypothetical protein n=1 Tax=Staphylococcus lugdunensis TaxID=28035 RepID=UPI001F578963|nr:hypothetical protein [Staphylococcus lugdunensis]MCI2765621.1 hypothetical protein [Staphylococcus lugdunensis]MCI2802284.1 hypothetical protein [Staphylococcus lugdunensis]
MSLLDDIGEDIVEKNELYGFKQDMKNELQTKIEESKTKIKDIDDDIWDWQMTVKNTIGDIGEYCEGKIAERADENLSQDKRDISGMRWIAEEAERSCKLGSWF